MEFTQLIRERYSCKKYDGRRVDPAQLEAILQAGRLAPTAKNQQEQKIYVIQSDEGLAKGQHHALPLRRGHRAACGV